MVALIPREEIGHLTRIAHMRTEDDHMPDAEGNRTLTGQEAIEQEAKRMHTLLTQLRGRPGVDRRKIEDLRAQTESLQGEIAHTTEHNGQHVLAGRMSDVSGRIENLLAV
ncbi:MAG: hypothetical protein WC353_01740 [Candidatus Peribacter sp.]|jgi:cell division FtsZ-interacting protein ZapD